MFVERVEIDAEGEKFTDQSGKPNSFIPEDERNCQHGEQTQHHIAADSDGHGGTELIHRGQQARDDHTTGEKRQGEILDRQPVMSQ